MLEGIDEATFWRQTPRQTALALRARHLERKRAGELAAWHALHVNVVADRALADGRFPSLASLKSSATGIPEPEQTPDDQLRVARGILKAFADLPDDGGS